MSDLTIVKPGQSIADAVKQDHQQAAQAKQLLAVKKQRSAEIINVVNALMQTFALGDPEYAASVAISYAAALSHGTGTSKEDYLKGCEKAWNNEVAHAEEVREEQGKMLINVAKNLMAQKRPITGPILGQLQATGAKIPEDMQAYIDAQAAAPAPEAKPAVA